jgi:hypothetical protein
LYDWMPPDRRVRGRGVGYRLSVRRHVARRGRCVVDRLPAGVAAEVAQQLGGTVVARVRREHGSVSAELAEGLDDGPGRGEQLRRELAGQQSWLAECRGDVPGVHGGVEGTGRSGCRGREWALRQRRRHRAVVALDPRPRGACDSERRFDEVCDAAFEAAGGHAGSRWGPRSAAPLSRTVPPGTACPRRRPATRSRRRPSRARGQVARKLILGFRWGI